MTDESDLIRAILLAPHDDAPRLIYADWLDDRGGSIFANFIRDQIAGEPIAPPLTVVNRIGDNIIGCQPHQAFRCGKKKHALSNAAIGHVIRKPVEDRQFIFERGFISEITLPLAVFVGGECQACESRYLVDTPHSISNDCEDCHGTGRVPGIAKELFERWPITSVKFTDGPVLPPVLNPDSVETPVNYGRRLAGLPPLTASPATTQYTAQASIT